jgi:alpha/beta superfamily hydrolase
VPDVLALAPKVCCPVLFIRGDKENAHRYPAEEFCARMTAPAVAQVIPDCDHFYNGRENLVIDTVTTWLTTMMQAKGSAR